MPAADPSTLDPATGGRVSLAERGAGRRRRLRDRIPRRWLRGEAPRTEESMLPTLIEVFAGFTKLDGQVNEAEIDSILGFLRYDFPETVYTELRQHFMNSLRRRQDLEAIAESLAGQLPLEDKVLLGVQLYVLISRAGLPKENLITFYQFMTTLVVKNLGPAPILARGRIVNEGEFCRIYEGQTIVAGEEVLGFDDLVFYFNSKKNVSSVQLYLARDNAGRQFIEKTRTKQSYLRVSFGLKIIVDILADTRATIGERPLRRGSRFEVQATDKIEFPDHSEIVFADLRKKAREFGGRFTLPPHRTEYLISNEPDFLSSGDILLSPGRPGTILLRIRCDYGTKTGTLEILEAKSPIAVEGEPVRGIAELQDGSVIALGGGQFLRCHFSEGIIEEERNVINRLKVREVCHSYDRKLNALEGVSFAVQRGEMVCVMGPSGCGKSTLLKVLAGQLDPNKGRVDFNGVDLYAKHEDLKSYIAFIPQDETFDPLLTVEENLDTAAAMRAPHFTATERSRRVDSKLIELGLSEFRHRLAGDSTTKNLSGGQRRRLNAGMDMIGIGDVYLFDEPTSGLSSKDSENVLDMIRGLTHNKITLVSIHQPSSRLFHMFDKALLLDYGGKLAFFGTPGQMIEYFDEARKQENITTSSYAAIESESAREALPPDFVFDILETPLRDLGGETIYERDARGNLIPARRFNPSFWSDRFQTYRLLEEVNLREIDADSSQTVSMQKTPQAPPRSLRHDWVRFVNQLKRAFLSKLRNRANLATTLLEAPALSLLMALVLRYSESGEYSFANAFHIPSYLFLSLVTALFLGLTNSAEEIIRDRNMLHRERHHGFRVGGYILAKYLSLGFFALVQCVIYLLIGDAVLGIRTMFFHNLLWMFSTSVVGFSAGLLISSVVNTPKTAINIIPLVLIPNIILGGALIKYDEMNRSLDLIQYVRQWFAEGEEAENASRLKVPAICHTMPLRWSYEAIVIAHAEHNPVSELTNYIEGEIQEFSKIPLDQELTPEQSDRLNQFKQALAFVYGLDGASPREVGRELRHIRRALHRVDFDPDPTGTLERELEARLEETPTDISVRAALAVIPNLEDLPLHRAERETKRIREDLARGRFDLERYAHQAPQPSGKRYTAEDLYHNEKILDLFNRAEVEREDYRLEDNPPNVFFGKAREYRFPPRAVDPVLEVTVPTLRLNILALIAFAGGAFIMLHISLTQQLRRV